ncbi:hypothetical protein [Methylibium sp.]|uniref:hypothetical protein n=1 Tax=Methylibium sp. TaxID=2067992 RepID=UPI0017B75E5E|nr:hypothetical protein [Methylibium sp.]MBA3588845.1 hypothetical protein [Methylibium sp.]
MTTTSEIRARLADVLAGSGVAAAASIAPATWASATVPHVFDGDQMATGGRNRGRLPFVEYWIASQPFAPEGTEVGMVDTTIRLRVHVGGADRAAALATADAIAMAAFSAIRADDYFDLGDSSVDSTASQPLWHYLDATARVQHSYDPATHEGD